MKKHTGSYKGIILHHTATPQTFTVADVRQIHLNKGFGDVGYHFLFQLGSDGHYHLKNGRSVLYQGGHTDVKGKNYNNTHIGVSIIGNFEKDYLTEVQYQDLLSGLCHLLKKFNLFQLLGHKEVKATACPGKHIDLNKLRSDLSKKLGFSVKK